jgi:ketosteroid isomerase-like protein
MTPKDLLAEYERRINLHDFDLMVELIAPDAVFWFSDGSHRGIDAVRMAFEATWSALNDDTYWLTDLTWLVQSDRAAACVYHFNWTSTIDGRPASGAGRGTTVLERRDDRWWIVHEHLSAPRP